MDWHITKTGNSSDGWTGYTWNRELFPDPHGFIHWLHEQGLRTALKPASGAGHPSARGQYQAMAKWMGSILPSRSPVPFDITDPHFVEGYFEILHHPYEERAHRLLVDGLAAGPQEPRSRASTRYGGSTIFTITILGVTAANVPSSSHAGEGSATTAIQSASAVTPLSGGARWPTSLISPPRLPMSVMAGGATTSAGTCSRTALRELYLRWVQFGVFSPIFRVHSTKKAALDRRPWSKPERVYAAAKDAMQLRHALIPYIYSMAWRAHRTGISLVTPMYYGNMEDASAFGAKDQYFFGSELLVAPILNPSDPKTGLAKRKVWDPAGTWFNFFTGELISGGGWREITAAWEDIPVYAKAGAIIPLAPKVGWGGIGNPSELDIFIFPGADNEFALYEDDGETTDYLKGKYAITRFSLEEGRFTIHQVEEDQSLAPAQRTYRIHLRGVVETTTTSLPGHYESLTRTLSLEPQTLTPGQTLVVTIDAA